MPKKEAKSRSRRKPLREIPSNRLISSKPPSKEKGDQKEERQVQEEDALDRLLLVHTNLSALVHQIDDLVMQACKVKTTNTQGKREIEALTPILSDMICSLKPWVPKIQKALSGPCKAEDKLEEGLMHKHISDENESPKPLGVIPEKDPNALISPSPLVSWRGECTIEHGRQLFLLTPLPALRAMSTKQRNSHRSLLGRVSSSAYSGIPSFCVVTEDTNDNLLGGKEPKLLQDKVHHEHSAAGVQGTLNCKLATPPISPERDCSRIATPCLKISPPKSCVLLEPMSNISHQGNARYRKATPFPRGTRYCEELEMSETPASHVAKSLALKYPELYGLQPTDKLGVRRKEIGASMDWFVSPPKTCAVMDPPNEEHTNIHNQLPRATPVTRLQADSSKVNKNHVQSHYLIDKLSNQEPEGSSVLVECTPIWNEPESTIQDGKRPGEMTLKKELWTRFEAASTNGFQYDISVPQVATQKGFLDRLDEVSCEETAPIAQVLR